MADDEKDVTEEAAEPQADELTEKKSDVNEPLLRLQADFQNFKRRSIEEQLRAVTAARLSVIVELLPVIDNFERAFADVPKEIEKSNWYGGVTAIKKQFETVLKNLGIERIETVGADFDPEVHEAITHEPHDKYAENVISEEYEAGYRAGDDVIRHARVKVSSGKK